jgi:hypothetical protein
VPVAQRRRIERSHDALYAEQTFGKEHVERKIRERRHPRQRGSAPGDIGRRLLNALLSNERTNMTAPEPKYCLRCVAS